MLRHMGDIHADYFGFAETKLETHHHHLSQQLNHSLARSFDHHRLAFATSPIKFDTHSKQGVSCIVINDLVGRVTDITKDILGRWTTTKLIGKDGKLVNMITAYQCVTHPLGRGHSKTVYAQQWAALRALTRQIDPRKAFILDLKSHVRNLHRKKEIILLGGNFNEVLGTDDAGLLSVLSAGDLIDVIHTRHPNDIEVPAYKRGNNRIDYIFISRSAYESVLACGADPFGARIQSDLRGFFIDLDVRILYGRLLSPMAPQALRGLQSRNLKDVTRYIDYLDAHFVQHRIYDKVQALIDRPNLCPTQANSLGHAITEGMLGAENWVKKKRRLPWSPKLIQAVEGVTLWKQAVSSFLNDVDMTSQIQQTLTKLAEPITLPEDLQSCRQGLQQSLLALRRLSAQAADERHKFLLTTIMAHEAADNPQHAQSAKAARHIQKAEEIKQLFRKLQGIYKSYQRNGLNRILVPDDDLPPLIYLQWRTIDVPDEVERLLLARNREHFGQAHGTPFTIEPLSQLIDWGAASATSDLVLRGTFDTSTFDSITRLVLETLRVRQEDLIPTEITLADLKAKYTSWNESTSTSPSRRHLGHLKALLSRNVHPAELDGQPNPDHDTFLAKRGRIWEVHHKMLNYALLHGFRILAGRQL
jgi:hypothetical protein